MWHKDMDIVANLTMRVAELERRLANVCRLAKVAARDAETATVTILFEGLTMEGVPFVSPRAGEDQVYWLPSVGELGVLFSPAGDIANAVFMPSLFFKDFPALEKSTTKAKRIFRDGTTEEVDTNANSYKLQVVDSNTAFNITADGKTEIKRAAGETVLSVGTTEAEIEATQITLTVGTLKEILTAICASIVGANFFPSGLTNLQSPVGPIFFAPTPPPSTAPTPPAGSAPSDGKATKTPPSTINSVSMSGTVTLPTIPITGTSPSGPVTGFTTAGTYTVTGSFNLTFPARSL